MRSKALRFPKLLAVILVFCLQIVGISPDGALAQTGADEGRYGLAGLADYRTLGTDMEDMGVRWYQNWQYNRDINDTSPDFEYYPMALPPWRATDNCGNAGDAANINQKILAGKYPVGTTWLIGNEVGANWPGASQAYTATDYAQRYHNCYQLLKGISPSNPTIASYHFKIANGSVLPNSDPYVNAANGLAWFRMVRSEYQRLFGQPMPVDVYNIHLYGPPDDRGFNFLTQAVTSFRAAMANEWNDRQKPLIVTEMGVIESISWDASVSHLNRMTDYLESATDTATGLTSDGNRLVQKWAWYAPTFAGSGPYYQYTHLYDGLNRTPLGQAYANKANDIPPPPPPPPQVYLKFVNVGGGAYTNAAGTVWEADQAYVKGAWGYMGGTNYSTTVDILNTNDDPLFQTDRRWSSSTTPGYKFNVPPGRYEVTLKFAETVCTGPNQRKFDIRMRGVTVISGLDIFAAVGGRNRPLNRVVTVDVPDGVLNIGFIHLGIGKPKINAIKVRKLP